MTYTFTLRPDGSWSDGQPVTAQNFVDGFLHILDPNAGYDYAYLLYPIAGAEEFNTGVTSDPNTVGLTALNATTLQITLHDPAVFFPQVVAAPGMVPIRQDLFDLHGNNWVSPANIVSSGAYLYTTSDRGYDILERNPNYRNAQLVAFSKIAFARYLNPYELVQAYKDGEVDAILQAPVRPTVNDPALASDLVTSIDMGTMFVTFNAQSGRITADPLVRKALAAAIDRRSLLDSALESSWRTEAQGVIPPDLLGHQGTSVGYGYNLNQAQQFLC